MYSQNFNHSLTTNVSSLLILLFLNFIKKCQKKSHCYYYSYNKHVFKIHVFIINITYLIKTMQISYRIEHA